jgi:hypothetical protein
MLMPSARRFKLALVSSTKRILPDRLSGTVIMVFISTYIWRNEGISLSSGFFTARAWEANMYNPSSAATGRSPSRRPNTMPGRA